MYSVQPDKILRKNGNFKGLKWTRTQKIRIFVTADCFDIFADFKSTFGRLECVGHSFAYVAHLWFLKDVWIRTQSTAVASWRATDLATHPLLSHPPST